MAGPIDIAFCFDDHLALPGAVAILSILAFRREPVRLHVLTDPSPRAEPLLRAIAERHGVPLQIVASAPETAHRVDPASDYGRGSTATYRRLFLAELLPELRRVLYLDADILVRASLDRLWETSLEGAVLGAVPDPWMATIPEMRREFPEGYFNAGVMLIDLERWRERGLTARCLDEIGRRARLAASAGRDALSYRNEQTPLNTVLRNAWQRLSPCWNFTVFHTPRLADDLGMARSALSDIAADPAIVHFLGAYKPWLPGFEGITRWHGEFLRLRQGLERDHDLSGLGWPRSFDHGPSAARARRLMAMRLVHDAKAAGFERPVVVVTGLLGRDVSIVAREQGLPIACFASEAPALAGGQLDGIDIVSIADAVDAGHRDFILGDYRRIARTLLAVEEAGRGAAPALRIAALRPYPAAGLSSCG